VPPVGPILKEQLVVLSCLYSHQSIVQSSVANLGKVETLFIVIALFVEVNANVLLPLLSGDANVEIKGVVIDNV
jgi:hypothetical protein